MQISATPDQLLVIAQRRRTNLAFQKVSPFIDIIEGEEGQMLLTFATDVLDPFGADRLSVFTPEEIRKAYDDYDVALSTGQSTDPEFDAFQQEEYRRALRALDRHTSLALMHALTGL